MGGASSGEEFNTRITKFIRAKMALPQAANFEFVRAVRGASSGEQNLSPESLNSFAPRWPFNLQPLRRTFGKVSQNTIGTCTLKCQ